MLFKIIFFCAVFCSSMLLNLPPSWIDRLCEASSSNMLRFGNTSGTFWEGEGDLILNDDFFGGENVEFSFNREQVRLLKNVRWSFKPSFNSAEGLILKVNIKHPSLRWKNKKSIYISYDSVKLPAGNLNLKKLEIGRVGGLLGTINPKFVFSASWSNIKMSKIDNKGEDFDMIFKLNDFETSLSNFKPLGSYRFDLKSKNSQFFWSVNAKPGSIIKIVGKGQILDSLVGRVKLKCTRYCEYLVSLLEVVGRKNGEEYEVFFGG